MDCYIHVRHIHKQKYEHILIYTAHNNINVNAALHRLPEYHIRSPTNSIHLFRLIAHDSIYAMARICYRPSVRLSVTRVDQSKMVEVRIMQLSPQSSHMTLVSSWLISWRNSKENIGSEDAK